MKEVLILAVISGVLFITFILLIVIGIVRKRKKITLVSIVFLVMTTIGGSILVYKVISKGYKKVSKIIEPRSGDEIYVSLLGKDSETCSKILHYQDQVVPKIDYAIWLHFKTCPKESGRILSEYPYHKELLKTKDWKSETPYGEGVEWWNPKSMGDSILVFEYVITEGKNIRTFWMNMDSTEVYCRDVLD